MLKNLSLWYFKSDQASAKALGVIVLPSYHVAPDDECDVGCGIYAFIATHSDARTYHFRTDTLSEMQTWMAVLAKACLATDVPATPAATAPTPIFAFGPEPGFRSQDSSTFCHGTHTDVGVKSPPIPEKPALLRGNSMHGKPIAHAMNIPMAERAPPCERLTEPAVATENTDNLSASFTKRLELLELKSRLGNTRSRAEPVAADLTAIPIPPPNVAPLKLPTAIPVVEPSSSSESEESNDSDIGGEYRGASWRRYSGRRDGISLGSSGRAVETYVAASYPEAVIHAPDDYIAWMNDVLFSGDFIVALDGINIPISPPPRQLQSITILFSDITDGVPLIEFLLRLAAKRVVEEALMFYAAVARGERASSESGSWMEQPRSPRTPFTRAIDIRYRPTCPESDAIGGALARLFKHYRDLYIPRPMYRVQMVK